MRYVIAVGLLVWSSLSQAKQIDLSTRTDASGTYEVAFCGRPSPKGSIPGHMFVAYSHVDPQGKRDFLSIGHTVNAGVGPVAATWSYFGDPVPGHLAEEKYTSVKQNCLDIVVNKEDFDKARAHADDPLQKLGFSQASGIVFEAYKLGANDCMTFAIDVANVLKPRGLKVPDRTTGEFPAAYVQRLIGAN